MAVKETSLMSTIISSGQICRLCKSTKCLSNLYMDSNSSLLVQTNFCLDLKINQNDGLPAMICKYCKRMIKKFYTFKQSCINVDSELKMLHELKNEKGGDTYTIENEEDSLNIPPENVISIEDVDVSEFSIENHSKVADNSLPNYIVCELCGSIYHSKADYQGHLSSHGETKLYQCKFCPKQFTRAESRQNHMRSHLGIRPYICEICGKSSTKRQDLARHMKIHSDERNHICNICGRSFKRGMDLNVHNRTHTGIRPYQCAICGKDYTSHSGLRKHRKQHMLSTSVL